MLIAKAEAVKASLAGSHCRAHEAIFSDDLIEAQFVVEEVRLPSLNYHLQQQAWAHDRKAQAQLAEAPSVVRIQASVRSQCEDVSEICARTENLSDSAAIADFCRPCFEA